MSAIDKLITILTEYTPEQLFELLTPENKAKVNHQIELLVAAQSSDQ